MKKTILLIITAWVSIVNAQAVTVVPGKVYQGASRIDFNYMNASFNMSAGWFGTVSSNGRLFTMANRQLSAVTFLYFGTTSPQKAWQELHKPIKLANGIVMHLAGQVHRKGRFAYGFYNVTGTPKPRVGFAIIAISPGGKGAILAAVAPKTTLKQVSRSVLLMAATTKFGNQGGQRRPGPQHVPQHVPSGGIWHNRIVGKRLVRYVFAGGYRRKINIYICRNGTVHYNAHGGSISQLGTSASQNRGQGRWAIRGNRMQIRWYDGTVGNYNLVMRGSFLYMNNYKYYRLNAGC